MVSKLNQLLIIILLTLGLLARVWQFGYQPASLYWDEVAIGLDARSIAETGLDINGKTWLQPLFYSYGDYKAPVYIWLTAVLGKLFSVSQITIRLPALLAGLLTGLLLYRLVKLVSSKNSNLPLFVLAGYAIMPWSMHFSRIGMESHLSLFWLTLSVYLTVSAAKKKQFLRLPLAALAVSLGIYSYISLRIIGPILFMAAYYIYHRQSWKKSLSYFILGLVIISTSLLVLIRSPGYSASQQYRLSNDNLITSTSYIDQSSLALSAHQSSLISRLYHHRYIYKTRKYLTNYLTHLGPQFLFISGDNNLRHHSGFGGQLLAVQLVILLFGLIALPSYPKNGRWLLLIWLFLSPTIAALVNQVPHASRAIYLIVPLAWLTGLGLKKLKPKLMLLVLIFLMINLSLYLHDYFSHYPSRSALAWINPYKQAALFINQHPTDKDIYVTSQYYQPQLYFQFYAHQPIKELTSSCPQGALCIAAPDWQPDTTEIIGTIPGTDQLVIKSSQ